MNNCNRLRAAFLLHVQSDRIKSGIRTVLRFCTALKNPLTDGKILLKSRGKTGIVQSTFRARSSMDRASDFEFAQTGVYKALKSLEIPVFSCLLYVAFTLLNCSENNEIKPRFSQKSHAFSQTDFDLSLCFKCYTY